MLLFHDDNAHGTIQCPLSLSTAHCEFPDLAFPKKPKVQSAPQSSKGFPLSQLHFACTSISVSLTLCLIFLSLSLSLSRSFSLFLLFSLSLSLYLLLSLLSLSLCVCVVCHLCSSGCWFGSHTGHSACVPPRSGYSTQTYTNTKEVTQPV